MSAGHGPQRLVVGEADHDDGAGVLELGDRGLQVLPVEIEGGVLVRRRRAVARAVAVHVPEVVRADQHRGQRRRPPATASPTAVSASGSWPSTMLVLSQPDWPRLTSVDPARPSAASMAASSRPVNPPMPSSSPSPKVRLSPEGDERDGTVRQRTRRRRLPRLRGREPDLEPSLLAHRACRRAGQPRRATHEPVRRRRWEAVDVGEDDRRIEDRRARGCREAGCPRVLAEAVDDDDLCDVRSRRSSAVGGCGNGGLGALRALDARGVDAQPDQRLHDGVGHRRGPAHHEHRRDARRLRGSPPSTA